MLYYTQQTAKEWEKSGFPAFCRSTHTGVHTARKRCVDDDGEFILTEDGKKIMPGTPEEKAYYAARREELSDSDKTEEEILEEMKMLDM